MSFTPAQLIHNVQHATWRWQPLQELTREAALLREMSMPEATEAEAMVLLQQVLHGIMLLSQLGIDLGKPWERALVTLINPIGEETKGHA